MLTNVKSTTGLSGFYIIFEGSTMNEKPGWFGLSHLCEHLVCKSFEHLQNLYQQKNIKWNAYTSVDSVVFFMKGLDKHINEHKSEFLDFIINYEVTQEQLDNEKKIILEEYKMSFNSQSDSHYLNLQRKLFGYYNPIGLRSDIENFTLEDCKEYIDLYFRKPSKIVNISKNSDFETSVEFSKKIETLPLEIKLNNNLYKITSDVDTLVPEGMIPLELLTDYQNKVSILNVSPVITNNFVQALFLCEMLGSGLNSPLYKEVREKNGLVYGISCFVDRLNSKSCTIDIMTDTSYKNIEEVQSEIRQVLANKEKYLNQERFDIIKEGYLTKLEEAEILNYSNVYKYVNEPDWIMENIINDITLQDIYDFVDSNLNWDDIYKSIDIDEFL